MTASSGGATFRDSDAWRTLAGLVASCLGSMPLASVFLNQVWMLAAWLTMALVLVPAALLRLHRPARSWHLLPGLLLGAYSIFLRFLTEHAYAGVLPTASTVADIRHRLSAVQLVMNNQVAPVHPTPDTTFLLCVVLGLFAAIIDLIAITARFPALAGVALLAVYLAASTIPRASVHWLLFLAAAAAYLLLLGIDSHATFRAWGPAVPRAGEERRTLSQVVSSPRIAAIAMVLALGLSAIVPLRAGDWLRDAFHNGAGVGGGGDGLSINPFAKLKGQLIRPDVSPLLSITVTEGDPSRVYYLRTNVLTNYDDSGWSADPIDPSQGTDLGSLRSDALLPGTPALNVSLELRALTDGTSAPILANPVSVSGLGDDAVWYPDSGVVVAKLGRGDTYDEQARQPMPTPAVLLAADPGPTLDPGMSRWVDLPSQLHGRDTVRALVTRIVGTATSRYDRARLLTGYFTNPANGFSYSLQTKEGDSGSDLVNFLTGKTGFCQQYAAALAVMMRMAGVPARVVLGYTHGDPGADGRTMLVTNANAHAWVEAYFTGVGWVPFDGTPITLSPGGATTNLPWAPHPSQNPNSGQPSGSINPGSASASSGLHRGQSEGGATAALAGQGSGGVGSWLPAVLGVLAVLALLVVAVPALGRLARRRQRLRAARDGETEALWAELSATATDLGYVWSPARTPRQVVAWLRTRTDDGPALSAFGDAVEQARYGAPTTQVVAPMRELRAVEAGLRSRASMQARLRARLLPQSLGWTWLRRGRRAR